MRAEEFVAAYSRECSSELDAGGQAGEATVVEAEVREARQYGAKWGMLLHDWMSGVHLDRSAFEEWCQEYARWHADVSARLLHIDADDDATCDDLLLKRLTEFSFHRLTMRTMSLWRAALFDVGDPASRRGDVAQARFELAADTMLYAGIREEMLGEIADDTAEQRTFRAWHTGMLTEIDAMIGLLEATRRDTDVFVLPAPPQFERGASGANVDILVIHVPTRQVRGVQVKSSHAWDQADRYDAERVVMLDGVEHLRNARAMRTNRRHSDRHAVSWPGLVGAHYLRALPVQRVESRWAPRRQVLNLKLAARHYVGQITDRNAEVFETCRKFVVAALQPAGAQLQIV